MNKLQITFYIILTVIVLYLLRVRPIVEFIDSYKEMHNYIVDYILTFRYKNPILFIALPIIAVWLMGKK